jgi:hypothetical protein
MHGTSVIDRSREADQFLASIDHVDPGSVSACDGWTAHDIAAHVTGIAVEVNRHLDPFMQGDPVPKTRSFDERERPLRDMDHADLLRRLDAEERRMRVLVADVLGLNPLSVIPWTGRHMVVAKFIPHLRNEHALHRWDVVGDDEEGDELLGQVLLVAGRSRDPAPDNDFEACLHSDGARDLVVRVRGGEAAISWSDSSADERGVWCDPAARLLFIWGRHPHGHGRLRSQLAQSELARLQVLLSGY